MEKILPYRNFHPWSDVMGAAVLSFVSLTALLFFISRAAFEFTAFKGFSVVIFAIVSIVGVLYLADSFNQITREYGRIYHPDSFWRWMWVLGFFVGFLLIALIILVV